MKNKFAILAIILVGISALTSQIRIPGDISIDEQQKTLSPYFQIISEDSDVEQFPLLLTKADVNIVGVIADVTVTQVYRNTGKKPIEAIYVFPASVRAAVYAMKMTIGERILVAEIQKKEEARATYENAKKEGKTASLLEQERPNVFQMNVANIMPGDSIMVEMKYTELLIPTDKTYEFVYPTVVGPRYSKKNSEDSEDKDEFVETPYQREKEAPKYKFDIKVNLSTGVPLNEVNCNTHQVDIDKISKNQAEISLEKNQEFSGNRDFVLKYKLAGENVETGLILSDNGKEKFFLLMLQPPKRIESNNIPAREYIFVLDVSGSMRGYPLDVAKEVMNKLFTGLKPTDKFNILFFAGSSSMLFDKSQFATNENIQSANEMFEGKIGGGGTELLPALNKIYEYPKDKSYSRTIVILTDGYVDVEKQAFELIRNKLNDANVFAVGIGNSVNRFLIEGMARAGLGEPCIIMNQTEAKEKADKFFNYIKNPIMTDLKIEYDGFDAYYVEPKAIPDVFADRPIIVYGKWRDDFSGNIKVSGLYGDKRYRVDIDVLKFANRVNNDALKYLWARNKISELNDYRTAGYDEAIKTEVTNLGLKYNLLTEYTSFVAVDYIKRNNGDSIETVKQVLPMPEGVSNEAVGYSSGAMGGGMRLLSAPMMKEAVFSSGKVMNIDGLSKSETLDLKMDSYSQTEPLIDLNEIQKNIVYPKIAKEYGFEGRVIVKALIEANGKAKNIEITHSEFDIFNDAAISAVKKTKFAPATENGRAKKEWVTIPVNFKLENNKISVTQISTGDGEVAQPKHKIKFQYKLDGIPNQKASYKKSGELTFKMNDEEYKEISKWFYRMKVGSIRNVQINDENISTEIIKKFKLDSDFTLLRKIEIELLEVM